MSTAHALIIDDNYTDLNVLGNLLSMEGCTFTDLSSAKNLPLELDKLSALDIVFLDLSLPKTNGYDVLKIIKAHPRFQRVYIVAYTALTNETDAVRAKGFNGFLGKPVNAEEFPIFLQRILSGEEVWY